MILVSCSKESPQNNRVDSSSDTLSLLQHKWFGDSVSVYAGANFSVKPVLTVYLPSDHFWDFRADGKLYGYGGLPVQVRDTTAYQFLPGKARIALTYKPSSYKDPDTVRILQLTANSLLISSKNKASGEYGNFQLRR